MSTEKLGDKSEAFILISFEQFCTIKVVWEGNRSVGGCTLTQMKMAPFFIKEPERNPSPLIKEFKLMDFVKKKWAIILMELASLESSAENSLVGNQGNIQVFFPLFFQVNTALLSAMLMKIVVILNTANTTHVLPPQPCAMQSGSRRETVISSSSS
jgi:carbon starvation protein CstA